QGEIRGGFWPIFDPKSVSFALAESRKIGAQKPASKNKNRAADPVAQPLFMSILRVCRVCQKQQFWQK
ncbi:MAG: hypothetical protein IIV28_04220, partial [Alistipes sp.]|nr:hypothetical protein [Alistipes sp.]